MSTGNTSDKVLSLGTNMGAWRPPGPNDHETISSYYRDLDNKEIYYTVHTYVGLVEGQEELNRPKMVLVMLTAIPEERTYFICYFG